MLSVNCAACDKEKIVFLKKKKQKDLAKYLMY